MANVIARHMLRQSLTQKRNSGDIGVQARLWQANAAGQFILQGFCGRIAGNRLAKVDKGAVARGRAVDPAHRFGNRRCFYAAHGAIQLVIHAMECSTAI